VIFSRGQLREPAQHQTPITDSKRKTGRVPVSVPLHARDRTTRRPRRFPQRLRAILPIQLTEGRESDGRRSIFRDRATAIFRVPARVLVGAGDPRTVRAVGVAIAEPESAPFVETK